ncbi:hypothetical protein [Cognatishimia sp. F0-27]|uniref:hypothetical protein n=1 Tax=Cognatishimia sp. F0-27 TaxID=2816855 RepID=UPI001D0C28B9|nr:hypothetical protein [Cognatishimia sp. F0-27]MCC1495068.1 hypothetical protein [Cognatishimia sp. F0-27]
MTCKKPRFFLVEGNEIRRTRLSRMVEEAPQAPLPIGFPSFFEASQSLFRITGSDFPDAIIISNNFDDALYRQILQYFNARRELFGIPLVIFKPSGIYDTWLADSPILLGVQELSEDHDEAQDLIDHVVDSLARSQVATSLRQDAAA